MQRRTFLLGATMLALTAPGTTKAAAVRAEALAASKARIRWIGRAYRSAARPPELLAQLATEARTYAAHHRALGLS